MTPSTLSIGSKIAVVAPAKKIAREEVQPAIDLLSSWGLEVVLGKNLFKEYHQFAGTDDERLADLQWALDHPEIKAILCARGGYGTVRLVDGLDFSTFVHHPKWIIGYSDITVLHSHIQQYCAVPTLHSTMPINFSSNTQEALASLKGVLFGSNLEYNCKPHPLNRCGDANGVLVGGNLSILHNLSGTKSHINTDGKILFLEDLDEYLYHIDRMIISLKRCGMLDNLKGLIVGGMTSMNDNDIPFGKTAEEIILEAVDEYDYPVCFGFPAGHIDDNRSLILGQMAKLIVQTDLLKFVQ